MLIGCKLYYFDSIDSTNEYAKSLINKAPEGTVILADQQTEGKGRFEKKWYSPADGIWMSVILRPPDISLISIAAGISVCEGLHMMGILAGLKWPNDILLNGKKIGGILTEIVDETVILGIGLNLNIRRFPKELMSIASSVFLETKKHLDKKMVFDLICKQLDDWYAVLKSSKIKRLLEKWRLYTVLLGQEVTIEMGEKELTGRVLDISNDGGLMLMLPNRKVERVLGGVCHLKRGS